MVDPTDSMSDDELRKIAGVGRSASPEDPTASMSDEELMKIALQDHPAVKPPDSTFGLDPMKFNMQDTTAKGGVERPGVDTVSGSPVDQTPAGAHGAQARNAAKVLPAVGMMALPAALPVMGGLAGGAAAVGAAGLGAAGGEAGRQIVDAATGEPETSSVEAAKKIGWEGAKGAVMEAIPRVAVGGAKLAMSATRNVGQAFLDFLGNVRRGTAYTAGRLPKEAFAEPLTVEAVKKYGQTVADTVKKAQNEVGSQINEAVSQADKAAPEGTIPVKDVLTKFANLKKSLRVAAPVQGTDAATTKAVSTIEDHLQGFMRRAEEEAPELAPASAKFDDNGNIIRTPASKGPARGTLTIQEAKDLLDRAKDAIPFDATNPGASKAALRRLEPFAAWLRSKLPSPVDSAMKQYSDLIEASDAIEKGLGIKGGEKVTLERVMEVENSLKKLLRESPVKRTVEQTALNQVKAPAGVVDRGESLAVQQELQNVSPATSGEGGIVGLVSRALRGAAQPVVRPAFLPAARGLDALRLPAGTDGSSAATVAKVLSEISKGKKNGK